MKKLLLILLCLLIPIGWYPSTATTQNTPPVTQVTLDLDDEGTPINPYLFGNNLQWRDYGDSLLEPDTLDFDSEALALMQGLAPTVIRYPGGAYADTFLWLNSVSEPRQAIDGQLPSFGLGEFLVLCAILNAEPLYTVNVVTDTPENAALLVTVMTDLEPELRRIKYWEIGNEPYLEHEDAELNLSPEEFASRANAFIRAMRAVDPTIIIGIPLQNDDHGSQPATPYRGFNRIVLDNLTEPIDFVAIHSAYRPIVFDPTVSESAIFRALMAGPRSVAEEMDETRAILTEYGLGDIPLAMTEYNTLFSIGVEPLDSYITSLGSALYIADVLRVFAERDDLLMANFWSLIGNWYFGAISFQNQPRPAYAVLQLYREKFVGVRLPILVNGPTFESEAVGFVPAYQDTPLITALAARDGNVVRVFLVNKDYAAGQTVEIIGKGETLQISEATQYLLTGDSAFAGAVPFAESSPLAWQTTPLDGTLFPLRLDIPPHSIMVVEFTIGD